jgi:ribonucleoside-diphosphate reductase alpha chain
MTDKIEREQLPQRRIGCTIEGKISGTPLYIRTGEYEDGRLGEIFIDMFKEGAGYRGLLSCFAISVSLGLQYGIPLEVFLKHFIGVRFEPSGKTDHPDVPVCSSIIDYIFKLLEAEYYEERPQKTVL